MTALGDVARGDEWIVEAFGCDAERLADRASLAALLDRVAAGELRVNIETAIPLERAPESFAAFADGTLGKVLITR